MGIRDVVFDIGVVCPDTAQRGSKQAAQGTWRRQVGRYEFVEDTVTRLAVQYEPAEIRTRGYIAIYAGVER